MPVRSRGDRRLGSPDDNFLQLPPSSNRHTDDNICLSKREKWTAAEAAALGLQG